MGGLLSVGTLLLWAIAIGSEYVIQVWPKRKNLLNIVAMCCFALALGGEYVSDRYDDAKQAELQAAMEAQGVPEIEWFQAVDADQQKFTLRNEPIAGSVEFLINGLID